MIEPGRVFWLLFLVAAGCAPFLGLWLRRKWREHDTDAWIDYQEQVARRRVVFFSTTRVLVAPLFRVSSGLCTTCQKPTGMSINGKFVCNQHWLAEGGHEIHSIGLCGTTQATLCRCPVRSNIFIPTISPRRHQ